MDISTNLDIISLDKIIRKKFENEKNMIPILEKYTKEIDLILSRENNDEVVIENNLKIRKDQIYQKLMEIKGNINMSMYILESMEYIEKYNQILKTPTKINFTGKNIYIDNKKEIVINYIKIFEKYWPKIINNEECEKLLYTMRNSIPGGKSIEKNKHKENSIKKDTCDNCGGNIFDNIENEIICIKCGFLQDISNQFVSYNEIDRINISATNTYDRTSPFMNIIYEFKGEENYDIPDGVLEKLKNDCKLYNLINISELSELENAINNSRSPEEILSIQRKVYRKVSKYHTSIFLKEIDIKDISKHLQLIHWKLTGQQRHNISHLEEKLLEDFKLLVELFFGKYKKTVERKSLLNKYFILYQLLLKNGYQCNKEEFFLLKTIERINSQDTMCQNLFKILGWKYHNLY